MAFRTAETGFDPQRIVDRYSVGVCENLFEALLTYDYLARPVKLVPLAAEAMPAARGRRHALHLPHQARHLLRRRPGVQGRASASSSRRTVDYAIKRFRDPKNAQPLRVAVREQASWAWTSSPSARRRRASFDYDAQVAGIEVRDRYTHQLQAEGARLQLPLRPGDAQRGAGGARGDRGLRRRHHGASRWAPGPIVLKEWVRRSKIVLERNPNHRGYELDTRYADPGDEWDRRAIEALARQAPAAARPRRDLSHRGRAAALPRVPEQGARPARRDAVRVHQPGAAQRQARAAASRSRACTSSARSSPRSPTTSSTSTRRSTGPTIRSAATRPSAWRCAARWCSRTTATRRSTSSARARRCRRRRPVPPGVVGYDPDFRSDAQDHDPPRAKALLDMFGYVDRDGDGWRELPDGRPLTLQLQVQRAAARRTRQLAELWVKSHGRRRASASRPPRVQFADLLKDKKRGQVPGGGLGVDRRLPRRAELPAAALRPEHRPVERGALQARRVRPALREVAGDARQPGAQPRSTAR